ncbi:sodium:solute symporter family transporter [Chitinophaga lutea]
MSIRSILFLLLLALPPSLSAQLQRQLQWQAIPPVPATAPVHGMYAGVSNGMLLAAGGVTLSELAAEQDGIWWYDRDHQTWQPAPVRLPHALASGVSAVFGNRLIIAGGQHAGVWQKQVYTIRYDEGAVGVDSLSALPEALQNPVGAIVDGVLYMAGEQLCYALDLKKDKQAQWQELATWPEKGGHFFAAASLHGKLYLFGEQSWQFDPAGTWNEIPAPPAPLAGLKGAAPVAGQEHLLLPGARIVNDSATLYAFNAQTSTWMDFGRLPFNAAMQQAPGAKWGNGWVVIAGGPGAEYPGAISIGKKLQFGWVNWLTLAAYLACMIWIGYRYSQKGQSAEGFFTAGGSIPWWAAGLSIYGSQISAITFMAVPAIVFATDWSLAIGSVLILATVPIVVRYYVPFFRRLNITSAYEYLEHRFSASVRLLGSISFICFQMGRMGIVLFLPAIAIASVTGINIYLLIVIMGVICIIYTVMGGIEAVVWTDVAQVVVLMGGAILCFFVAAFEIQGGFGTVWKEGLAEGKLALWHPGWRADQPVLWVMIVGFFFLNIIPYTSDQTVVQKYLTVKDERQSAKGLWVNAAITMPGTFIFFGLGTVLYVFYKHNPAVIASDTVDEILPYFVVQQLPAGVSGLVIAGIFAASQSSLSSSMNSIAATFFSDIWQRFRPAGDEGNTLRVARIITIVSGVFGTVTALLIVLLDVQFMFDLFQEVLGILGGSLAGAFMLGIFTRKANTPGVFAGVFAGVALVFAAKFFSSISVYLYGAISVVGCVIVGYLVSLATGGAEKNTDGWNYRSLRRPSTDEARATVVPAMHEPS